jgi:predicted transcriptional regulator
MNENFTDILEVVLNRFSFMERLREQPSDKRTLVEELDYSRSTVDRALRNLEALELVEYVDGEYRLTPLGDTVTTGIDDLSETIELNLEYEPFLQWMPDDEFDLDPTSLRDAELVLPKPGDPYAVINRHVQRLETLEYGRFLLPYAGMHATEKAHEQIVEHGARCELVVASDVWTTFQDDPSYTPLIDEILDSGRVSVYRYDEAMPFALALFDDHVQIIADESEEPRALVEGDTLELRTWAETTFSAYKQGAEPLVEPRERPQIRS